MKLVFVHGWGCHAGVWSELAPRFPGHEIFLMDLGFVRGGPKGASLMPEDALCIGHSFGVIWLLKHGPRRMKGLISIAGFDAFYRYVPEDVLPSMRAGMLRDPHAQMRQFWQMCGYGEGPGTSIDAGTLRAGLDWLGAWDESERTGSLGAPIMALAARDDPIVRTPMTEGCWGNGKADLRWLEAGGHMLPLTHADWCAENIVEFIDELHR